MINTATCNASMPRDFVAIDFETMYPQHVSACAVGMVKYKEGKEVATYLRLIRPPMDYPGKRGRCLTSVHHITADDVRCAPTLAEVWEEMRDFVEGLPLVAQHSCTEYYCLVRGAEFYRKEGMTLDGFGVDMMLDTETIARRIDGNTPKERGYYGLTNLCETYGVLVREHHDALADAHMCGDLYLAEIIHADLMGIDLSKTTPKAKSPKGAQKKVKLRPEDKKQRLDWQTLPDTWARGAAVVITGIDYDLSAEYYHRLHELGAQCDENLTTATTILVVGARAFTSTKERKGKVEKALERGNIYIMPFDELDALLEEAEQIVV